MWRAPQFGAIRDPPHAKLAETRKAVVIGWLGVAALLYRQGESALAGQVWEFVKDLPPVLTDRERLAMEFVRHMKAQRPVPAREDDPVRGEELERTR